MAPAHNNARPSIVWAAAPRGFGHGAPISWMPYSGGDQTQAREIEAAKDSALHEISQQAIDLAAMMSSKAMKRQITPDDHRRLLDESLAELAHLAKPSA